jgi:hypothetical protein
MTGRSTTTRPARRAAAVALAAVATVAGCRGMPGVASGESGTVALQDRWPSKVRDYGSVVRDWTRTGRLVEDYDRILEVRATFKSPEWRAAYVRHKAKRELLPSPETEALRKAELAASKEFYEVELLVSTYEHRENDLQKGEKSVWRLALVDDQGNEVRPVEVKRDRRPRAVIAAYFPELDDFHTPYVARFPRTIELLRPGARRFSFKMASSRGGVELVWRAR